MSDKLVKRLNELGSLNDGWLNGDGMSPTLHAQEIAKPLAKAFDCGVRLYPTETGGLLFEAEGFEIRISSCGVLQVIMD